MDISQDSNNDFTLFYSIVVKQNKVFFYSPGQSAMCLRGVNPCTVVMSRKIGLQITPCVIPASTVYLR
jgi:hypothetical protein